MIVVFQDSVFWHLLVLDFEVLLTLLDFGGLRCQLDLFRFL